MPYRLQEIILDLENNYGIIRRINSGCYSGFNAGIILLQDLYRSNKIKENIFTKYNQKICPGEYKFIKTVFAVLRPKFNDRSLKYAWFRYTDLKRLFNVHCLESNDPGESTETTISTGKKKSPITKKRGTSGDSLHSSSPNAVLRVEEAKVERVKNSPLCSLVEETQKPLHEMEIYLDPHTILHATRLMHKFGADPDDLTKTREQEEEENRLYSKIIRNLQPQFNDFGWAWPDLYINRNNGIKAHFTIQMHDNGRFIIPTKRGMNLREFIEEFDKVFYFLTPEEIIFFFNVLRFYDKDHNKNPFVHLANEVHPEKNVEKHLDKAKLRLYWINHLGTRECTVKVDRSVGSYEVEIEGRIPESYNLNQMLTIPQIVVGSFQEIADTTYHIEDGVTSLKQGQTTIYQQIGQTLSLVQDVKQKLPPIESNIEELLVQEDLNHGNLTSHLKGAVEGFSKTIQGLNQELNDMKSFIWKNTEQVIDEQRVVSKKITAFSNDMRLLKSEMNFKFDDLQDLIESKFSESRPSLKDSLTDILTVIGKRIKKGIDELDEKEFLIRNNMVSNFISDLQDALRKSKSTIYNYLKKLCKKGLLRRIRIRNGPGRPHYFYYLPKKDKNT